MPLSFLRLPFSKSIKPVSLSFPVAHVCRLMNSLACLLWTLTLFLPQQCPKSDTGLWQRPWQGWIGQNNYFSIFAYDTLRNCLLQKHHVVYLYILWCPATPRSCLIVWLLSQLFITFICVLFFFFFLGYYLIHLRVFNYFTIIVVKYFSFQRTFLTLELKTRENKKVFFIINLLVLR